MQALSLFFLQSGGHHINFHSIGIPIGTVTLPKHHIHSFRMLLQDTLQQHSIKFRGIEKNDTSKDATIHLPPLAAARLDEGHPDLQRFLCQNKGSYHPGVRGKCPTLDLHLPAVEPKDNNETRRTTTETTSFRFVELFAGIGGFRLGLEAIGGKCVLANEINEDVASIYQQYFHHDTDNTQTQSNAPSVLAVGDILDLHTENLPEFDCLAGGFPCQPFTMRGRQPGLNDDHHRGQLYRELARILAERQPKCFLFENVPGLVTMQGGQRTVRHKGARPMFESGAVLDQILMVFRHCGYQVDWQVLNSRKWLPQMRERVYLVGRRSDLVDLHCGGKDEFQWEKLLLDDLSEEKPISIRDILEPKDAPSVAASELTNQQFATLKELHIMDINGKAPTLTSGYHSVHERSTMFLMEEKDGTSRYRPRFLTPRECSRLMGFPESFPVPSPNDKLATKKYYQAIGNAVSPIVITSIAREMMKSLGEDK